MLKARARKRKNRENLLLRSKVQTIKPLQRFPKPLSKRDYRIKIDKKALPREEPFYLLKIDNMIKKKLVVIK